jgi:hypothetical protein
MRPSNVPTHAQLSGFAQLVAQLVDTDDDRETVTAIRAAYVDHKSGLPDYFLADVPATEHAEGWFAVEVDTWDHDDAQSKSYLTIIDRMHGRVVERGELRDGRVIADEREAL